MDSRQSTSNRFFLPQNKSPNGYPQDCFEVKELKPSFECKTCKRILKAPHQDDDGGRYCYYCAITTEGIDTSALDPDRAIEKQMLKGLVHCRCDRLGCDFHGDFQAFRLHYDDCQFDFIQCSQCEKQVRRNELEKHQNEECANQEVACSFCRKRMRKSKLQEHHDRECMSERCIFGCELSGLTNMLEHHKTKHQDHLFKLNELVQRSENAVSNELQELASLDDEILDVVFQNLREHVQIYKESSSTNVERSKSAENAAMKPSTSVVAKTTDSKVIPVTDRIYQILGEDDEREIEQLLKATEALEGNCTFMKTFITETYKEILETEQSNQRNYNEILTMQTDLEKLKLQFSTQVDASQRLEAEVRHLETTTNDGLFVFRIPEWSKHLETAKNNENYSVYSTSFYTHQGGYRLRMRVFPFGEKDARGKFLSAYINVLKGPYDAILPWPFRRCIVLTCLDQRDMKVLTQQEYSAAMSAYQQGGSKGPAPAPVNDPRKDISFRLRPDPLRADHKRAFGQPQSSENPSIGFLRFVPVEAMVDSTTPGASSRPPDGKPMYCRSETVFLRCVVEPIEP